MQKGGRRTYGVPPDGTFSDSLKDNVLQAPC